jgi:thioredoxin reductase-like selenoprotein T
MKRNFEAVKEFLEVKFPKLRGRITGANYPTSPFVDLVANVMSIIQMAAIAWMVVGGEKVFRMLGFRQQLPAIYSTIQQNSIPIGIFLFLILPQWIGKFTLSGAFEIYLDDKEIFSKLSTGDFPTADGLVALMLKAGLEQAAKEK